MAGIDDVLERLVTDPDFKAQFARDPSTALAGYDLTEDDLTLLSARAGDQGGLGAVEQRTSKAGFFGMLAGVVDSARWAGPPAGGVQGGVFVAAGDLDGADPGDGTISIKGSDIGQHGHQDHIQVESYHWGGISRAAGGGGMDIAAVDGVPPPPPHQADSVGLFQQQVGDSAAGRGGTGSQTPTESHSIVFEKIDLGHGATPEEGAGTSSGPRPGVPITVTQGDTAMSHHDAAGDADGRYLVTGVTHAATDDT